GASPGWAFQHQPAAADPATDGGADVHIPADAGLWRSQGPPRLAWGSRHPGGDAGNFAGWGPSPNWGPGFSAKPVIRIWVGPQAVPDTGLVLGLSLYVLVAAVVTPASVMLYGVQRVGGQAIIAGINAIFTVAGGILLTRSLGTAGMAVAMAFA